MNMAADVVGRPLAEAERLLSEEKIHYVVEISRPTRDFFKIDEKRLYVIRQKWLDDGRLQLTLAAKLRKEVF